ncbi:MAG TPA: hypothetical protein VE954_14485 [Oligoflexus sp.]|uniref:hypothetical protein n=1 Tax=Oligoflexus sp. TaxID=1971216 RepID=UPI002D29C949|nr:hypothetical protein [Oligoflexus sp.]HYX34307.1 hypothetical protein [Oligoflexus sp.]
MNLFQIIKIAAAFAGITASQYGQACSWRKPHKCQIKDIVEPVAEAAGDVLGGVLETSGCVAASTLSPLVLASMDPYKRELSGNSRGRMPIPACLHGVIDKHYGIDPNWVEVHQSVSGTPPDTAITLDNKIFFPTYIDIENSEHDLAWLLHELQHVA